MKKILAVVALSIFLFVETALAVTWHTFDGQAIGWDAVITLGNGNPIPVGDTITYNVYIVPETKDAVYAVLLGNTANTEYLIGSVDEGRYFVGVSTVRLPVDSTINEESEISWSANAVRCYNNETFGLVFYASAATPKGLHYS